MPALPVNEVHFALYLQHLGESSGSVVAVQAALNAVCWIHQLAGFPPPSSSGFVRATVAGLQRQFTRPKVRKEPITQAMLASMVKSAGSNPKLSDVRLLAIALLAFSAFLRFDELSKLRCCDITFQATSMIVHVTSSKTDQFRQGADILVSRSGGATCPVAMLEQYYAMASLKHSSTLPLFRGLSVTKNGERLRTSGALSYTRMRELLLTKLTSLGYDSSQFGLHSLRAGGATAAANAGIPDRLFKRHGRWRSESAKDGYVKDSTDSLLSVSKSLKL